MKTIIKIKLIVILFYFNLIFCSSGSSVFDIQGKILNSTSLIGMPNVYIKISSDRAINFGKAIDTTDISGNYECWGSIHAGDYFKNHNFQIVCSINNLIKIDTIFNGRDLIFNENAGAYIIPDLLIK